MVVAGFLYSSWPLGYWLNPQADHGLASNLEALHQPYNWLFILIDISSGVLTFIACRELLEIGMGSSSDRTSLGLWVAIWGAVIFGLFTAIDAVIPLDCVEGSPHCMTPLHNPYFVIHGVFRIGSVRGLTVSIVAIWLLLFVSEAAINSLAHLTPAMFLLVWLGFGILTLPYFVRLVTGMQPTTVLESDPFER